MLKNQRAIQISMLVLYHEYTITKKITLFQKNIHTIQRMKLYNLAFSICGPPIFFEFHQKKNM